MEEFMTDPALIIRQHGTESFLFVEAMMTLPVGGEIELRYKVAGPEADIIAAMHMATSWCDAVGYAAPAWRPDGDDTVVADLVPDDDPVVGEPDSAEIDPHDDEGDEAE